MTLMLLCQQICELDNEDFVTFSFRSFGRDPFFTIRSNLPQ